MDSVYSHAYCALDLETTGVNPYRERIIEVGIVRFDLNGSGGETFHALVNPEQPVSVQAYSVHGISDEELADKPLYSDIADEITAFIGNCYLVIQNPSFDLSFLHTENKRVRKPGITNFSYDTVSLSRKAFPALRNHKLDTVATHLNISRTFHRALDDALCCRDIFIRSLERIDINRSLDVASLKELCGFDTRRRIFRRLPSNRLNGTSIYPGETYAIRYIDKEGVQTERKIITRNVYQTGSQTVIHAFCCLRGEERYFNVKRIQHIESC